MLNMSIEYFVGAFINSQRETLSRLIYIYL